MLFKQIIYSLTVTVGLLSVLPALAVDSGSSGSDGAFAPTADIAVNLPTDGILHYTTVNIPAGVTVRFVRNQANSPAFVLVKNDAVIDGIIDISGLAGGAFSVSSPPGGFAGGLPRAGGLQGGNGKGPGGGYGTTSSSSGAGGGGYAFSGQKSGSTTGSPYGSVALQPLLGGSGGGAGKVEANSTRGIGFAGGSGGGALLLAVSGTLTLNGSILAKGGDGESEAQGIDDGSMGGGGSGGAVRIVATTLTGSGVIDISGGQGGLSEFDKDNTSTSTHSKGGNGSLGRVRIEVELISFSGQTIPPSATIPVMPQAIFLTGLPTIRIASIAGQAVPASPSGFNDVIIASNIKHSVTIEFEATGVPENTTVLLTKDPQGSAVSKVTSSGLTGDGVLTASVTTSFPDGNISLLASVAFSVSALQSQNLSVYTQGEPVERVELASNSGGGSAVTLITKSGRSVQVSPMLAALNAR